MHRKKPEGNSAVDYTKSTASSLGAAGNHPMAPDASKPGRRYVKKTSGAGAT